MHFFRMILHLLRSRRRSARDIWDTYSLPMRVHLGEVDIFMHLNNGKYLSIMDLGRLDMMMRSGAWQAMRERGWSGVVSGETISFRKSLKLWQRYTLETKICGIDERTVFFEHRMTVGGEIFARAYVGTRVISDSGPLTRDDLIEAFGVPENVPELPEWIHEWRRHNALPSTRRPAWSDWSKQRFSRDRAAVDSH